MNTFILLLSLFRLLAASAPPPPPPVNDDGNGGGCPSSSCGSNGTRVTGLAVDLPGELGTLTLASGERVALQ
jgi:hypothetical protein